MARWLIWSQVGFVLLGIAASYGTRNVLPQYLFPAQPIFTFCALSAFVYPLTVLSLGRHRNRRTGQLWEFLASMAFSLMTLFVLMTMIQ